MQWQNCGVLTLQRVATLAVCLAATATLAFFGQTAIASEGSIPAEVQDYADDPGGLVARLDDLFGVGSSGKGITFDETTEVGHLNRVFTWTGEFLDGTPTEVPVERQNQWVAPIVVGAKGMGLATIWINPATVQPELAEFVQEVSTAQALADIPSDAYLVHDVEREAWFTLVGSTLTPLVPGQSGISSTTTVGVYQGLIVRRAENIPAGDEALPTGIVTSVLIIGGALVGTVFALWLFHVRERRAFKVADEGASNPEDGPASTS